MALTVSYLHGAAHEWWLGYKLTDEGRQVTTWPQLHVALIGRFETLNKIKIARDKLKRWKIIKDGPAYNEDFQKILLDIATTMMGEQLDRYARCRKTYIWRELCANEYSSLGELMRDPERVEMARRRFGRAALMFGTSEKPSASMANEPVPMEIGNIQLKKINISRTRPMPQGRLFFPLSGKTTHG